VEGVEVERLYDLVGFDVDGTLVDDTVFVWQTLHDYFGTDPVSRDEAFDSYMAGKWTYAQWFGHDIRLLKEAGACRKSIAAAISGMKLSNGVPEVLEELRVAGAKLVVISGSLDVVADRFELHRYFDEVYLNRLEFDSAGKLSGGVPTPYDVWDKARGLREVAARLGVPMARTAFVGDNFNDVAVAREAGFSIAFNCKSDELAAAADAVVDGRDMRAILPYLLRR